MTDQPNVLSNNEEPGKYIVSATKWIIETKIAENSYQHYSEGIIEKTTIRVYYIIGKIPKLTVTPINSPRAGLH